MGICFPPESLYMYSCRPRRRRSTLRHPEKTGSYSLYENVYRSMPLHRLCFFRSVQDFPVGDRYLTMF